ncbi:PepSY domain-containing protein [Robertmurraya siralis]|uniref:PepSY domain-containing protein n=1 Tax=Robertmurraya siralis TaxID=77777 RepID=UPI001BB321F2|nr:PepSY domain-containing protein [Robertmurraya siralis]
MKWLESVNWKKMSIGLVVIFVVVILTWQLLRLMTVEQTVSAEEAKNKVQELYKGEIVNIEETAEVYQITIKLDTGKYEIEIARNTGDIGKLNRVSKAVANTPEEQSSEGGGEVVTPESPPEEQKEQTHISKEEAISIALSQVKGEIDDVDIEQSNGLNYYLVEIETNNDREATVQINAISGEVMSITWDD